MTEPAIAEAPETSAEPTTEEAAADPIFDKLMETISDATGTPLAENQVKTEATKSEAEKAEGEATEEEAETSAADDWDDLGDDKPWSKERHEKIREQHRNDRRNIGKQFRALDRKREKFGKKLEQFKQDKRQVELVTTSVMNDIRAMKEGTPDQALAALGRLSQSDPHSMYERLSLTMLGKAPQQKADPKVAELEAKVERLTAALEQGRQAQTEEQQHAGAQRQVMAVLQSAEEWPILAEKAAEAPEQIAREFWQLYMQQCREAGRYLDVETVADRIERTLRRKVKPSHQATHGAAGVTPGREQGTRAAANPEMAQSPPRSLSPSLSAVSGGRRESTEEELADEFARNPPPGFFEALFG